MKFLVYGIIWLFIFSIPVQGGSKKLFDLGQHYIVDSRPVKRLKSYFSFMFTNDAAVSKDFEK